MGISAFIVPFLIGGVLCGAVFLFLCGINALLKRGTSENKIAKKIAQSNMLFYAGCFAGLISVGFIAFALIIAYSKAKMIF